MRRTEKKLKNCNFESKNDVFEWFRDVFDDRNSVFGFEPQRISSHSSYAFSQ